MDSSSANRRAVEVVIISLAEIDNGIVITGIVDNKVEMVDRVDMPCLGLIRVHIISGKRILITSPFVRLSIADSACFPEVVGLVYKEVQAGDGITSCSCASIDGVFVNAGQIEYFGRSIVLDPGICLLIADVHISRFFSRLMHHQREIDDTIGTVHSR